jgi:hypothetical protein
VLGKQGAGGLDAIGMEQLELGQSQQHGLPPRPAEPEASRIVASMAAGK